MKLNGVQVVERQNRPGTLKKVLLRSDFINSGSYFDPYQVSSVSVFRSSQNISPSSVLDSSSQLLSEAAKASVKFRFTGVRDASNYTGSTADASSIYKDEDGRYLVILDGTNPVSSVDASGNVIENQCSSVGRYIDVWTVKMTASSDWQVFIHEFELHTDSIISLTEPLLLKTKHHLTPNIVDLGEKINMKISSEITVQNKSIDSSIKNTIHQSFVQDAKMEIVKTNSDSNLPARVEVSGFSDTSADIRVTADNTMVLSFDTASLTTSPPEGLGSGTGDYYIRAKFNLLDETLITPRMYFTVR